MKQPWILVDFDGTAVDTLPLLKRAFFEFGRELGIRFSDKDFERSNGPSLVETMRDVRRRFSLGRHSVNELVLLHERHEKESYGAARARPDLRTVLRGLRKEGWKCALVTSAPRSVIQEFFKRYRWDEIFEFAVTGDDVKRAKPHADLYELAKSRAGGKGPFLAIEDSSSGIEAARRADCIVLRFGTQPGEEFLGVSSFRELRRRLRLIDGNAFLTGDKRISFEVSNRTLRTPFWRSDDRRKVTEIWQRARKENRNLFDGPVFVAEEEARPFSFLGRFMRYRHIYPQLIQYGAAYPIRVAVSAVVRAGNTVSISKRSRTVTESPGKWEFAPSGAVGSNARSGSNPFLDLEKQMSDELREEFGIVRVDPQRIIRKIAVFDLNQRIIEVIYHVVLQGNAQFRAGTEHTRHTVVTFSKLKKLLLLDPESFTPITRIIAKQWLKI